MLHVTRQRDPYTASGDVLVDWLMEEPLVPPTAEQVHNARLTVCERARDAADAGLILRALGLEP